MQVPIRISGELTESIIVNPEDFHFSERPTRSW